MKKGIVYTTLAVFLLLTAVAVAQILFLTVTAGPHSEAGGGATISGNTTLYLSVSPSAELPSYQSRIKVYDNGTLIYDQYAYPMGPTIIATYTYDARHNYTLVVEEQDGITITAKLYY